MQNKRLDPTLIHFILVEPIYEGNVGAIARILNNFGFANLRIVGAIPSKNDFYLAMHSEHILSDAQVFDDLASAVKDLDRVIAFSRRLGKQKPIDLSPPAMASYIQDIPHLKIGLVFGRETYGLTDEEAGLCALRCHIPANPAFPSINLAQAVAIAAWELYRLPIDKTSDSPDKAAKGAELAKLHDYMLEVMQSSGFFRDHESTNWDVFLTRLLATMNPTQETIWRLRQMFNRWHVLVTGKGMGYERDFQE